MNGIGLGGFGVPPQQADYVATDAQSTGNFLVLLVEGAEDAGLEELQRATGAEFVNTADTSIGALEAVELQEAGAVVFDKLGVVLVRAEPQQIRELRVATAEDQPILVVEPERVVSVLTPQDPSRTGALPSTATPASIDYLRGYQDAVVNLVGSLSSSATAVSTPGLTGLAAFDESEATWGLQVTGVTSACSGGQGQRAAVLDTGLDLTHPDFTGRGITSQSFIAGEAVQDGHGHGTHCIGTAMGPLHPQVLPRYGIAYGADIFAGKVLNNQGRGADGGILAGINWAVTNGCRVVSMSLGAPTAPGQSFSRVFEAAAQRALAAGTLIVAAAGNESQRSMGVIRPVGHPANCPSIMAVAALDEQLQVANFSTRGINPTRGADRYRRARSSRLLQLADADAQSDHQRDEYGHTTCRRDCHPPGRGEPRIVGCGSLESADSNRPSTPATISGRRNRVGASALTAVEIDRGGEREHAAM